MATTLTLSLRESAKYDWERKLKAKLTGWGIISRDRRSKDGRLSKTQKRKQNRGR